MSLVPNFSSSQSLASPNYVTFTDASTGSDLGLTSRRIYVVLANGNWLTEGGVQSTTEAYITWPIADSSIQVNLLTQSTVASTTVKWMTGGVATYTKTILSLWNLYDYLFYFSLIQSQTATPTIISDANYYSNCFIFITNIFNSECAVTYGNDLYSSNAALLKNQWMIDNSNDYF